MAKMCGCAGQCGDGARPRGQSQESLTTQLDQLTVLANQHGLYDAADYVKRSLARS